MDEARLIERLRRIEALFAGATTAGERVAADLAKQRLRQRLGITDPDELVTEYQFSMVDMWSRKVFVALLRRHGIQPYRYKRQRYTTVMAQVSKRFVDKTLWPEFQEITDTLRGYLAEVTDRVIADVFHQQSAEAEVVETPRQLTFAGDFEAASEPAPPAAAKNSGMDTDTDTGTANRQTTPAAGEPKPGGSGAAKKRKKPKKRKKRKRR